jgi:hypothetical protein
MQRSRATQDQLARRVANASGEMGRVPVGVATAGLCSADRSGAARDGVVRDHPIGVPGTGEHKGEER